MNDRPLIGIARGGYSGESVVSMLSAKQMMDVVDRDRYEAVFLTIHHNRQWTAESAEEESLQLNTTDLSIEGRRVHAVLIAIHGSPGEDGLLQGYLEMQGIPYQTGDVLNMSVTFSKYATTGILRQLGYPVAPSILVNRNTDLRNPKLFEKVEYPCFVKPDRSGSSLGITKVKAPEDLPSAIDKAFEESKMVMVENGVVGRELTCGVLRLAGKLTVMPVCEIITDREYFDYEAKYHSAGTQEIVPAAIPDDVTALCQDRSARIYEALDCAGLVRIDHFWTGTDLITIEINTVPGFSPASIFPKMLHADGLGISGAINGLIQEILP
jgi:D-alanine-D-alanine ligase